MLIVLPGSVRRFILDLKNLDTVDEGTKQKSQASTCMLCRNKNIY